MSDAGRNRRDKAAAARAAAESSEKRRERTIRIVGAATVAVVVLAIVAIGVIGSRQNEQATAQRDPVAAVDPAAPVPAGVLPAGDEHAFGVTYGTAPAGAPTLAVWEDFQCPACGALEEANGAGLAKLAEEGTVRLVWRPTAFLDRNLGTDASQRAIAAWGCAIDQGKAREFHDLVYANQPEQEGAGFADDLLRSLAEQAGVADLAAFDQCVADGTYRPWAANSTQAFYDANVQGTPSGTLDGVEVPTPTLADQAALEQFIANAAK